MNNFLNLDIDKLSYKIVKEKTSEISISDSYKSEELRVIINRLLDDKRKNVSSLGKTMQKHLDSYIKEINRVKSMYEFDKSFGEFKYVAGVDEVGRGPLAGPIVACSVILDLNVIDEELILYLNDSKKLNHIKREELAIIIKEKALAYSISLSSNKEIDERGIAYCNNNVFLDSCNNLSIKPELVLSDGYLVKNIDIANKFVIKGDTKSASIAAASILAKVYRDNLMKEYSIKYPHYDFENNMGYGTQKHIDGLKKYGKCEIHRNSFLNNIL
ncbi:ribonuclease HII [Clostridium botulinum]|uniref:Ribonuclease HII n=1 Tax=Clostridium botulinum TaxID=1491 RepID=A0A6B4JLE1_CLOBO|nr:ribonuclease HII [Clostridium botulinum]EES50225.1 ribonuclease HII [Clostridium botulinum E1 str. 'BoNT E Beluga']MBY6760765.1 ribonuclease HII [Clostridium botulinum]MBY6919943.1 ribonuclease HII [Clostridium botulinum]MCR1130552.1 ribonuclease HII [Clostridium botulinum]NFJ57455.1 ribonuclease HII [Clostridium botulinum]